MNKNTYEALEMEIIAFDTEDVITTSDNGEEDTISRIFINSVGDVEY